MPRTLPWNTLPVRETGKKNISPRKKIGCVSSLSDDDADELDKSDYGLPCSDHDTIISGKPVSQVTAGTSQNPSAVYKTGQTKPRKTHIKMTRFESEHTVCNPSY